MQMLNEYLYIIMPPVTKEKFSGKWECLTKEGFSEEETLKLRHSDK